MAKWLLQVSQFAYACLVAFTFVISLLVSYPVSVLLTVADHSEHGNLLSRYISAWAKMWLSLIGMRTTVQGYVPKTGTYIVVANHISYLDPLMLFAVIPFKFLPLGKVEITSLPMLGFIYRKLVIPVNRDSRVSRAQSMRLMQQTLQAGRSIVIFPEGGFNETNDVLKPFHDGAFRLAVNEGLPILPLLLPDTVERWHYSAWYKLSPGRNRAVFLPPVNTEGRTIQELRETVRDQMAEKLKELKQR